MNIRRMGIPAGGLPAMIAAAIFLGLSLAPRPAQAGCPPNSYEYGQRTETADEIRIKCRCNFGFKYRGGKCTRLKSARTVPHTRIPNLYADLKPPRPWMKPDTAKFVKCIKGLRRPSAGYVRSNKACGAAAVALYKKIRARAKLKKPDGSGPPGMSLREYVFREYVNWYQEINAIPNTPEWTSSIGSRAKGSQCWMGSFLRGAIDTCTNDEIYSLLK